MSPKIHGISPQDRQLATLAASLFASRSTQSVSDFCQQHFYLPKGSTSSPGPIRFHDREYLIRPLDCWGDPAISDIDYCFATQIAKTTLLMCGQGWSLVEDPGNTLWILATDKLVRSFNRRRWHVFVDSNEILRLLKPKNKDFFSLSEQHFEGYFVKFGSARATSDLIETPIRRVIFDELDSVKVKAGESSPAQLADERTKTYRNALRIKASSPGDDPSPIWESYERGTKERYQVRCIHCEQPMLMDWRDADGGYLVKWDPEALLPNGKWDIARVEGTAHYQCPHCQGRLDDGHKLLMQRRSYGAQWISLNPNPEPRHVSFQLGSIYSPTVTLAGMAKKWIECNASITGLKTFITGWLGEVFRQVESAEIEWPESDYGMCQLLSAGEGGGFTVDNPDLWKDATHRIMTIDKQEGKTDSQTGKKDTPHVVVVVREWAYVTGASRLLWRGRLTDEGEARAAQTAFGIPNKCVFMDHGYQGADVARTCAKYGWTALKGDEKPYFVHILDGGGAGEKAVRKPYSKRGKIVAFLGAREGNRNVPFHEWSNPTIKDALQFCMEGKGPEWKQPRNVPEQHLAELRAEVKRKKFLPGNGREVWQWIRVKDTHGVPLPNEAVDLECMQIVGALINKIKFTALANPEGEETEKPKP